MAKEEEEHEEDDLDDDEEEDEEEEEEEEEDEESEEDDEDCVEDGDELDDSEGDDSHCMVHVDEFRPLSCACEDSFHSYIPDASKVDVSYMRPGLCIGCLDTLQGTEDLTVGRICRACFRSSSARLFREINGKLLTLKKLCKERIILSDLPCMKEHVCAGCHTLKPNEVSDHQARLLCVACDRQLGRVDLCLPARKMLVAYHKLVFSTVPSTTQASVGAPAEAHAIGLAASSASTPRSQVRSLDDHADADAPSDSKKKPADCQPSAPQDGGRERQIYEREYARNKKAFIRFLTLHPELKDSSDFFCFRFGELVHRAATYSDALQPGWGFTGQPASFRNQDHEHHIAF